MSKMLAQIHSVLSKNNDKSEQYELVNRHFHNFIEQFIKLPVQHGICLCHGSSGELEVMNELILHYSNLLTIEEINFLKDKMQGMLKDIPETNGNNLGVLLGLSLNTFMLGTAGVGYTQLWVMNSSYPSLLMINIVTSCKTKHYELNH